MRDRLKLNFLTLVTATFLLGAAATGFAQSAAPAASAPTPFTGAPIPQVDKPTVLSPVAASGVRQFGTLPRIKATARSADFIVAVVNSESVTNNEVQARQLKVQQESLEKGGAQPTPGELHKQALDSLVEERVLVTYARDNGVKVDDAEVDRAIANIAQSNKMTPDQLQDNLLSLKKEQFNLRFQAATGQMEKTHRVNEIRKDIARIKTVLRGKAAAVAA